MEKPIVKARAIKMRPARNLYAVMRPIQWCIKTRRRVELAERENEKIVEKMFEAWNRRDLEAFMSHLSDDVTVIWPSGRTVDKERLHKELSTEQMPAFPDSRWRVDRMVSQGDTVWVESTETGTHKGDWFRIPATNKKIDYPSVAIFDFEAGKVKLWKEYFDRMRFLNQLNKEAITELWDKMRK